MSGGVINSILLTLILLGGQSTAAAADWRQVQAIPQGTQIKLDLKAGPVEGAYVAANADVLVIHLRKGDFSVDRVNIKRLDQRLPGSNRMRNLKYGLSWGLAGGLLRSGVACDGCSMSGGSLVTLQSMLIGTIVGATSSSVKWETVYRR